MSTILLDILRKSELDQYFTNFSSNGITQLESLAQLSMQDYNSLGIVSIQDRKKLFQLVQSLRQELPTKENGLVSSNVTSMYRRQTRPNGVGVISSPTMTPSSLMDSPSSSGGLCSASGLPDISALSIARQPTNSNGSTYYQSSPPTTYHHQPQQQVLATPSGMTRSRSRTLLDQHTRSDLTKKAKASSDPFIPHDQSSEDEQEMPEIRRATNPLLNPYGIPTQNNNSNNASKISRSPFSQQQQKPHTSMASTLGTGYSNNNGSSNSLGQSDLNQKIRVCVRKRPLNKKEIDRGEKDISPTAGIRSINVNEPKMKVDLTKYIEQHSFTFDDVFDIDDSNDQIYQRTAQPLVNYVFKGGKATCFAYGQTGSGKTFTMLDPQHGLYVLAARDVFALLCQPEHQHLSAYIGFYEIYQGQLYDLLNARKKLFAREDGKQNVVIVGLKEYVIKNVDDLMKVFEYGNQCRSTGSTGANSDSSRSHAILQILLKPTKNKKTIIGKLSFIDLAGSERGADRGETDVKTRMEGAEINKSLLALKECIRALDQDKRHTPFRQSKLTQVLKDSFVGHSRTCMIATISPNQGNSEHTLNTLRYADRVKELKGEKDRRGLGENSPARMRGTSAQEDDYYVRNAISGGFDYQNSDDPDLSQDDDLFLGDEDFPSDGDVHILDEDFPHETCLHDKSNDADRHSNTGAHSPSTTTDCLRPGCFEKDDTERSFSSARSDRQTTPYHRSSSSDDVSKTAAGGLVQHVKAIDGQKKQLIRDSNYQRQQQQGQSSLSASPSSIYDNVSTVPHSRQLSGDNRRLNDTTLTYPHDTGHFSYPSPRLLQAQSIPQQQVYQYQQYPHPQGQPTYDLPLTFTIDPAMIDEFMMFHRAEIRKTSECSKRETKLLTHFALAVASRKDDEYDDDDDGDDSGNNFDSVMNNIQQQHWNQHRQNEKTTTEFHGYLHHLDEVLEMKMAAIDALRDRIRMMLGEEGDIGF